MEGWLASNTRLRELAPSVSNENGVLLVRQRHLKIAAFNAQIADHQANDDVGDGSFGRAT